MGGNREGVAEEVQREEMSISVDETRIRGETCPKSPANKSRVCPGSWRLPGSASTLGLHSQPSDRQTPLVPQPDGVASLSRLRGVLPAASLCFCSSSRGPELPSENYPRATDPPDPSAALSPWLTGWDLESSSAVDGASGAPRASG